MAKLIRDNGGVEYYKLKPMFIDDIGKETKEVRDYGTIVNPVPDLFSVRYDFGAWTLATCNYKPKELTEFYGETIVDRFKEMFNYLVLTGKSRRQ